MKLLIGIARIVNPETSFRMLRQLLPPGNEIITTSDFTRVDPAELADVEIVITVLVPVSAALLAQLPQLRLIQATSHGYDHIDVEAATARGIPVCNVASTGAEDFDAAEVAMLFMLALSRRLVEAHTGLRTGQWNQPALMSELGLTELNGKTLGIIGLGRIGSDLAKKARAFDMRIIYYDIVQKPPDLLAQLGATYRFLDELLAEADYVSINADLNETTLGLINARRLALMKPTAFLINTARGAIVDKQALAAALTAGRIAGAATDVFDEEPPPPDHPWLHVPRMYVTPHLAGTSREAFLRIGQAALANVFRLMNGEPLQDIVNEVQPATGAGVSTATPPAPGPQAAPPPGPQPASHEEVQPAALTGTPTATPPAPGPATAVPPAGLAPAGYGMARQLEVYLAGQTGQRPHLPVDSEALERAANAAMTVEARGYLDGMAGTMRANLAAFERRHIIPRLLRNVAARDLSVELFGHRYPAPVLLAPIGVQSILHPDGELAVACAAAGLGVPLVFSTAATVPLEQLAAAMGDAPRWFQLYWSKDPAFNASIVARAEQAGCQALVVTLDTFLLAWRPQDIQNAYLPFLLGQGIGNYLSDPAFCAALPRPPAEDPRAAIQHFIQIFTNPALTWTDLAWLRERTHLPILLKGILHPDDARRALDAGADGIVVSNHGGRQVEGAIAALDALPPIAAAVGDQVPILFDSGIRRAADVIKAVALGARAVLLGRPYLWGLALAGEAGVREVLFNFLADLDLTLALSGYTSFAEIDSTTVTTRAEEATPPDTIHLQ